MATRLPPAEKVPLAVRKNIRDKWDDKKADFEQKLSDVLGVPWTIDIDPKAIYPYAESGYAHDSPGSCVASYVDDGIFKLKYFAGRPDGADNVAELNKLAHTHVLTLDLDEEKKFTYCGCDIKDGKLRMLFNQLAVNIGEALDLEVLKKALNEAPAPPGTEEPKMSFVARSGIRQQYEGEIEKLRTAIGKIIERPDIKLTPNFEDTYAKLGEESKRKGTSLAKDWERSLGRYTYLYFESLKDHLGWGKFDQDEMLREGFTEAVEKDEVVFRVVDKLKYGSYCEVVIEDGVLYLQTIPEQWGVNIQNTAEKLMDQL